MNRVWKTIESNEDYEVSNDGLVRIKDNKKVLASLEKEWKFGLEFSKETELLKQIQYSKVPTL